MNVDQMTAGPELDEIIAIKVMGLHKVMGESCKEGAVWKDRRGLKVSGHRPPRYSTDMGDAWEIVEELRLLRITLSVSSIEPFDPKVRYCEPFNHDEKYQVQRWNDDEQLFDNPVYGKTAEEAVCKVALKIIGSQKKRKVR